LLRVGGLIVVSEPPPAEGGNRWPPPLLVEMGLVAVAQADRRVAVFRAVQAPRP
jgi:hypothetical protein